MKKNYKAVMVAALVFLVMIITSCDGLFTRTMTPSAARDPALAAKKIESKSSEELVADAGNVDNMQQAQTVVSALSKKANDNPEVIKKLKPEEKKQVITAATTAVIDMAKIGSKIDTIMNMMPKNEGGEGDGGEGGIDPEEEEKQMREVASSIFESFGSADVTCVEVILEDAIVKDGDEVTLSEEYKNDPDMQKSLAMGTLAVAASKLTELGKSSDDVIDMFIGTGDDDDSGSGDGGAEVPEGLEDVANTFTALMKAGFDPSSLFAMGGGSGKGDDGNSGDGNDD